MTSRIAATLVGMLACTASLAARPTLPVDSAATASRALSVALDLQDSVRYPFETMIDGARDIAVRSLAILDAGTTPAAAMQGVTLACPLSGTLTAKLSRPPLRRLSITWDDCASLVEDQATLSFDGKGELVLGANSFDADFLLLLQLGNAGEEFVETWRAAGSEPGREERVFSLAAIGRVPLTRNEGRYHGQFFYALDGELDWRFLADDAAGASPTSRLLHTAKNLVVRGSTTWLEAQQVLDEDLTISGSTQVMHFAELAPPELQQRFSAQDFRVHRTSRPDKPYFDTLTVDGRIDYLWTPGGVHGCGDGRYSFRTLVPIVHGQNGSLQSFAQGKIVLNGAATATFLVGDGPAPPEWYTPGPDERPTLVRIDMGSAGVYEHTSFAPLVTLPIFDGCFDSAAGE
jgi:hypothetical protein